MYFCVSLFGCVHVWRPREDFRCHPALSASSFEAEFSSLGQKPSSLSDPPVFSLTAGDMCLPGCLACYMSAGIQSPVLIVGKCVQLPQLALLFIMTLEALSFYFY